MAYLSCLMVLQVSLCMHARSLRGRTSGRKIGSRARRCGVSLPPESSCFSRFKTILRVPNYLVRIILPHLSILLTALKLLNDRFCLNEEPRPVYISQNELHKIDQQA